MPHNLQLYHKVLHQLCQWLPSSRITRARNLALLIVGLCLGSGIHLATVVSEWPLPGKEPSLVNRLRRFLDNQGVTVRQWYQPLLLDILAAFAGKELRLVIDSTKVGFNHRLLVIGLAYRKRTLPLAWSVHEGRRGHTSAQAQIELFEQIRWLIPAEARVWVMGDTEFESVPLLHWLRRRDWHFVIRQRGSTKVYSAGRGWLRLDAFALEPGQTRVIGWVRLTEKHSAGWFWLVLHWEQGEDEPWYLVADCSDTRQLIRYYKVRMWIEEMFGDMKGHGLDLEATHLQDADRISRLFLGVCITFVWFITLGTWVVKRGWRHFIDRKDRRDKSYFRLGWDWLKRCKRLNQPLKVHFKPYP